LKKLSIVLAGLIAASHLVGAQDSTSSTASSAAPSAPAPSASVDIPPALVQQNCDAYYPTQEAAAGTTGKTWIAFDLDASGGIRNLRIAQTSGSDRLDQAGSNCLNSSGINFNVQDQRAIQGGAVANGIASVRWARDGHSPIFVGCSYPIIPLRLNQQGETGMTFRISVEGKATNPIVSKSSGYAKLDAMALSCATNLRYTPAMHNGAPIETDGSYKFAFELKG
jgi:TonB family protein